MALPTLSKTWQFNVNSASKVSYGQILFSIKDALVSFGSNPWTVVRSSNGSVANDTDNWASAGNVVWSYSGHSWIVLKQTGIATNFQILLETSYSSGGHAANMKFWASPSAGFSGGGWSTSVRPTATDEVDLTGTRQLAVSNYEVPGRVHVMMSTDGQCTRWVVCVNSKVPHLVAIDLPQAPISAWTDPWVGVITVQGYNTGATTDWPTYSKLNDSSIYTFGLIGGDTVNFYLTSAMYGGGMVGQNITVPDDQTGEWPMAPIGLACQTTGHRGVRKGTLFDMWWASTAVNTGNTYPGDASNQFAQFGDIILPWSGSAPLIA